MKSLNIPEGQRKLVATIVSMVVAVLAEKYLGGLSDNLALLIGSALALFVGGNAMEYVAQIKGKKIAQEQEHEVVDDVPQQSGPSIESLGDYVTKLDNICGQRFVEIEGKFTTLEASMDTQVANTQKLIGMINKRGGNENA